MEQQKRLWRLSVPVLAVLLLIISAVIGILRPLQTASAQALPAGYSCPAGSTYRSPGGGAPDNKCYNNFNSISCEAPYREATSTNALGEAQEFLCYVDPTIAPGTPAPPPGASDDNAGTDQADCDENFAGTVFTGGFCLSPANEADCQKLTNDSGNVYTFEKGEDNASPDGEKHNKCTKSDDDPCIVGSGGSGSTPLRWLVCPLIEGANVLLVGCPINVSSTGRDQNAPNEAGENENGGGTQCDGGLNGLIRSYLYTDQNSIFDTASGSKTANAYYDSWKVFRTLGVGLIVVAGLIMIVSEAFGVGFVDAYTIRKLLPRLLVAAVGVTLSWSLCAFIVTVFNDLGSWANDLIIFPFRGTNAGVNIVDWDIAAVLLQWFAIGGAVVFAIPVFLGWMGILSLLGSAILALLLGVAILIIRQIVIVLCVLVAPLAIACSVLPNTQKVFTLWLNTFVRTMAMYPIIIAFLALGVVFSWLASRQDTMGAGIIGTAAYILPYFMLPYAFSLSGGAMSTVVSTIQDKSKGAFEANKGYRRKKMGSRYHDFKHGDLKIQSGNNMYSRKLQNAGLILNSAGHGLRLNKQFGRKGHDGKRSFALHNKALLGSAIAGHVKAAGDEAYKEDSAAVAMMAVDHYARAMGGKNEKEAEKIVQAHYRAEADRKVANKEANNEYEGDTVEERKAAANKERAQLYAEADHTAHEAATYVEANGGFSIGRQGISARALPESGTGLATGGAGEGWQDLQQHNAHIASRLGKKNKDGSVSGVAADMYAANLGGASSKHAATGGRFDATLGAGTGTKSSRAALQGKLKVGAVTDSEKAAGYVSSAATQREQMRGRHSVNNILTGKPMEQENYMADLHNEYREALRTGDADSARLAYRDMKSLHDNRQQANQSGNSIAVNYYNKMENLREQHASGIFGTQLVGKDADGIKRPMSNAEVTARASSEARSFNRGGKNEEGEASRQAQGL